MPYRKEIFENDEFYHIITRGFSKQVLFKGERDFLRFLVSALFINYIPPHTPLRLSRLDNAEMKKILDVSGIPETYSLSLRATPLVRVSAFSLLSTHAHFLLKQITDGGIQIFAQRLQNSYAKYFNIKNKKRGSVFEKNFYAVPIEDDHQFRYVVGYIMLNPLDTAGVEWRRVRLQVPWERAEQILEAYPWSSYHYFTGKENSSRLVDGDLVSELFPTPEQFTQHLQDWRVDEAIKLY